MIIRDREIKPTEKTGSTPKPVTSVKPPSGERPDRTGPNQQRLQDRRGPWGGIH